MTDLPGKTASKVNNKVVNLEEEKRDSNGSSLFNCTDSSGGAAQGAFRNDVDTCGEPKTVRASSSDDDVPTMRAEQVTRCHLTNEVRLEYSGYQYFCQEKYDFTATNIKDWYATIRLPHHFKL